MTPEQIKEKYGIELILKEGWCWDSDKSKADKCFCLKKDYGEIPYICYFQNHRSYLFRNFSEINPNSKEPQIGDWGWFWNTGHSRTIYDELTIIHSYRFEANGGGLFDNFSHKKPSFLP